MGAIKLKRSTSPTQPYYFTVVSPGNGQTLVTSETYTSKSAAVNGMQSLVQNLKGTVEYDDLT